MALSPKQQRFVDEYLVDLNATQAAVRAGYSARTACSQGERLLRNVEVQAYVTQAQADRRKRTGITADRVVAELARIAFADIRQLVSWGPNGVVLLDSAAITDDAAACVSEVTQTVTQSGGTTKIKLHPKPQALRHLGEHLGLWKPKTPLEELLAGLPAQFADALRGALAGELPPE